ncbi:hypothetical protein PSTT_04046 [Puccinia striiformis]|uniref:Uncharacterized protein n=1 Tax=Puccinia striiformis TaxID=27350 RepID=A0A2S4VUA4_9BASI|nr:hypothetical protein PSTT_04046 [Puccinia striiformis]
MPCGTVYAIDDFPMYLILKLAAPECPPCQSDTLPPIFEGEDDDVGIDHLQMRSCRGGWFGKFHVTKQSFFAYFLGFGGGGQL